MVDVTFTDDQTIVHGRIVLALAHLFRQLTTERVSFKHSLPVKLRGGYPGSVSPVPLYCSDMTYTVFPDDNGKVII